MSRRTTAEDRLERVLLLLPELARRGEEGMPVDELARALGVEADEVLADLRQVQEREYYLPPGEGARLQLTIERDRVGAWTSGELTRPVRLSAGETLALFVGLRDLAPSTELDREERGALAGRLVERLARPVARPFANCAVTVDAGSSLDERIRATLENAATVRRPCRLRYLKPGEPQPQDRTVEPYTVVYVAAEAAWYVLARSPERDAVRGFRLDRILEVAELEGSFDVPEDFDPADHLTNGRLYRADEDVEALVRYSPKIARWIEEEHDCEKLPDGSVLVRHRVADPDWLVRHVLMHAPEAEVVEPAEFREAVRRGVEEVLGGGA